MTSIVKKITSMAYFLIALSELTYASEQVIQWQNSGLLRRPGQDFLDLASDGNKGRIIDGTSIYSVELSGKAPRLIVTLDKLVGIAYANGLWVVAAQDQIYTSTDGNNWIPHETGTPSSIDAIAGGDNGWIALTEGNSNYLFSSDGNTWQIQQFSANFYPSSIAWGNGTWIASSFNQHQTSTDGISWSAPNALGAISIAWTGNRWLLSSILGKMWSSPSGSVWSELSGSVVFSQSIAGNTTTGVTVGTFGKVYKEGATAWEQILPNALGGESYKITSVKWTGTHFVAVGPNSLILSSPDGMAWTVENSYFIHSTLSQILAASPNGFLAANSDGSIFLSYDGLNWENTAALEHLSPQDVKWCIDRWYIIELNGSLWESIDGVLWTMRFLEGGTPRAIANNTQQIVIVGDQGLLKIKDANHDWSDIFNPTSAYLKAITWGGDRFVAAGQNGVAIYSSDGLNWSESNVGFNVNSITWTGSEFLAAGDKGKIASSTNGSNWDPVVNPGEENYNIIRAWRNEVYCFAHSDSWRRNTDNTWSNLPQTAHAAAEYKGIMVTVSFDGSYLSSVDGKNWTLRGNSPSSGYPIVWGGGKHIGCGPNGHMHSSEDGVTWTAHPTGILEKFEDVCWGSEGFVAVGKNGAISSSRDGITWNSINLPNSPWLVEVEPFLNGYLAISNTGQTAVYKPESGWVSGQLTSPNGSSGALSLATNQDIAICLTYSNYLMSSTDGITWNYQSYGENNVVWDGFRFICSRLNGAVTSPDGIQWTQQDESVFPRGMWHTSLNGQYFITTSHSYQRGSPETGWERVISSSLGILGEGSITNDGQRVVFANNSGQAGLLGLPINLTFSEWAQICGILPDASGFMGDINGDGMADGIAYLLGAQPGANPIPTMKVPLVSVVFNNGQLAYEVRRPWPNSNNTTQTLCYSDALSGDWVTLLIRNKRGWIGTSSITNYEIASDGGWEIIRIPILNDNQKPRGFIRSGFTLSN